MTLLTPGPVELPIEVVSALAQQPLHHRSDEFFAVTDRLWKGLSYCFVTTNPVIVLAGSGMTGIEAAMCSTLAPDDAVLILVHGRFGQRLVEIAHRHGYKPVVIEAPWGSSIDEQQVVDVLNAQQHIKAMWLVHCETSTGVGLPLQAIATAARNIRPDILIGVDAVTSIGVQPVLCDDWDLDLVVATSQKGLMSPPGIAAMMVSHRARTRMDMVRNTTYTMDIPRILEARERNRFVWTPPVNTVVALVTALDLIASQSIESIWQMRATLSTTLQQGLCDIGYELFGDATAIGVTVVNSNDPSYMISYLKERHQLLVAGAQGLLQPRAFRIGTMGWIQQSVIEKLLEAMRMVPLAHKSPTSA